MGEISRYKTLAKALRACGPGSCLVDSPGSRGKLTKGWPCFITQQGSSKHLKLDGISNQTGLAEMSLFSEDSKRDAHLISEYLVAICNVLAQLIHSEHACDCYTGEEGRDSSSQKHTQAELCIFGGKGCGQSLNRRWWAVT